MGECPSTVPQMHQRGQAMVEFALTFPLALLLIFSLLGGGFYAWSRSSAVQWAAAGVRVAAGGTARAGCLSCLADNTEARVAAEKEVADRIRQTMFGDKVVTQGGRDCSSDPMEAGVIEVCSYNSPDPDAAAGDPDADDTVTLRVRGRLGLQIPRTFGFNAGAPLDVHSTIHRLTFSR